jgi:hypothetical protein
MATGPIKRVYMDTNMLHEWPKISTYLKQMLGTIRALGCEICIPQVVEDELERQFLRDAENAASALQKNIGVIKKLATPALELNINADLPSRDDWLKVFHVMSAILKAQYSISVIPLPAMEIGKVVAMAVNRVPPFEEISINKDKNGVVGLQDAAIFFTIVEHLQSAATDGRCVFITADKVFQKKEIERHLSDAGVVFEVLTSVNALTDDLVDHARTVLKTAWMAEIAQVTASLNEQKEQLADQIVKLINPGDFANEPVWKFHSIDTVVIRNFFGVMTDLESANLEPPTMFTRVDQRGVQITASAKAEMSGIVDKLDLTNLFTPSAGPSETRQEPKTITDHLLLSLTGTVTNGAIANFIVQTVEPLRPIA